MQSYDQRIRTAAFDWLSRTTDAENGMIDWSTMQQGFVFEDERISLVSMRGIFKPRQMKLPLSIRTSPQDPYGDAFEGSDVLLYRYFGKNPSHPDNQGLREVMNSRLTGESIIQSSRSHSVCQACCPGRLFSFPAVTLRRQQHGQRSLYPSHRDRSGSLTGIRMLPEIREFFSQYL
ncbi:MAG: hypothetical protein KFH87_07665 [Bacteroidetes bacterium]|nr:hypothetical protein [Bacteroidota bacterium]